MDGLDFSSIDQIDQDVFNGSPSDNEECDEMPIPDCIGLDSAVQDDQRVREEKERQQPKGRSRMSEERDLELQLMKPGSIRRQILEQSMNRASVGSTSVSSESARAQASSSRSHVMNISEKAGMSGIDKDKINQIIHEASKGSLFYKRQAQRQSEIHKSIEKMLNRVKGATPNEVAKAKVTCDKLVEELEKQRQFNRIIVHFDLDMFFAAVEIRDNPELKDKPVAVGGDSMVSTSNYVARKYGVRAAMPGFIAKKLCPDLVLIKPNGFKYRQASSEVFAILEQFDPELTGMSLDEAYLDLTEYVKNTLERDNLEREEYYDGTLPKVWWTRASEVVEEIRQAIFDKTKLTCSAGIACNTLLSKISTDINKPNGQFMVQGYPMDVEDFISKTPVEKVSGIGKVSAQFLNALGIKTCGDIFAKKHFLPLVFYEINVRFYLRVALGDGSTSIKSDEQRKSKSVERTFPAIKDSYVLLDKLDSICEELCSKYLKPYRIRGRTVTIKLKRNTFMTTTRSYSMLVPTNDKLVIFSAAKTLLMSEIANEPPEISYRLLGVRLSNLADDGVTTNQLTIDALLRNQVLGKTTKSETLIHQVDETSMSYSNSTNLLPNSELNQYDLCEPHGSGPHEHTEVGPGFSELAIEQKLPEDQEKAPGLSRGRTKNGGIESFFSPCNTRDDTTNDARIMATFEDSRPANAADEMLSDSPSRDRALTSDLNKASQQEQMQNQPHDDDFQCPYCFKPYADFTQLEKHVDNCKMKIPIDVNKSFIPHKSSQLSQSPASVFFSQFKSGPAKSQGSQSTRKFGRIKKQPRKSSPPSSSSGRSSSNSDSLSQSVLQSQSPYSRGQTTQENGRKTSYYERFIESNSQSLQRSLKVEPLQCPYCAHGFLSFSSLESHVVMCTKKLSSP